MNIETAVSEYLWGEIKQNYEEGRYTDAIKDCIMHLSNVIREKSNVEGDGAQLIGDAFGGIAPKIQVTKLKSENDKNVQRGVEALLRGIYQAVRNPRSHDKISDSQRDADAIILFVDYLLRIINQSQSQFSLDPYLSRVFDNSFVKTSKYAELLVADIPQKRRMDVMIAVLDKKEEGNGEKLRYFFDALFPLLDSGQQEEVFQRLSKELQLCESGKTITTVIQILRASDWPKLDEAARLRTENKLIESIAEGAFNQATGKCTSGGLGTWASRIFRHFTLKTQAIIAITNRLCSRSTPAEDYGLAFLFSSLPVLSASPDAYLQRELISKLEAGDERFLNAIQQEFSRPGDTWAQPFKEALAKFVPAQPTEPEQDDVPF